MFRCIIISPDEALSGRLASVLEATNHVTVAKTIGHYPTSVELVRSLRAHASEILFLDFEAVEKSLAIVKLLEAEAPHLQIVGFHGKLDPDMLRQSMRAGVREFLTDPFERATVTESLAQIKSLLEQRPAVYESTNQIFSFLPSKAGVGASTVALNVSAAVARTPNVSVLLSDFDLNSGMLRFMLKLDNESCILDAVERCSDMDENLWPQLVTDVDGMDVLHAGRINPNLRIEPSQIRSLMAFMRRNYNVLCFDLSGNLEKYSLEIMQESKRILMVCTPEIPSLHLAREKLGFLKQLDLDARTSVVLNRTHKKSPFSVQQVEEIVGLPVITIFPNDYAGVNQATQDGTVVAPGSEMGHAFSEFAALLIEHRAPQAIPGKRRFLEFFASSAPQPVTSIK